jgi:hypothetical protein
MKIFLNTVRAGLLAWIVVSLGGCGPAGSKPRLAPVRGRVVYHDQAMTSADIFFLPDASKGNEAAMASSPLQLDGSFTLTTYPHGEGVLPGAYKATLSLGRRKDKDLDRYRNVETTPLEYTVPAEGLTDLLIELK